MTKKKRLILGLLVTACCAIGLSAALLSNVEVKAATLKENVQFEQTYSLNELIQVPESKITYGGKEYDADIKIVYPDGSAHVLSEEGISATQAGIYTVVYYTVAEGKYVSVEKQFAVKQTAITFSGDNSTYYYGSHTKYATEKEGIVLSLAQGESMRYNRIIDLSALNGERVFSMFAVPESNLIADANCIVVTFTDIYDANNSVSVRLKCLGDGTQAWSNNHIYCDAKASAQGAYVGLEMHNSSTSVEVDGGKYALHKDSTYGSAIYFSLAGYIDSEYTLGDLEYGISFDLEKKTIYSKTDNDTKLISDLDNVLLYADLWEGFTTGEVFMSVSAENYQVGKLGLVFTDIAGHDLSTDDIEVQKKPMIEVDLAGYTQDDIPNAIVGEKYKIFNAYGHDVYDGEVSTTVKVYYGYHSTKSTRVWVNNGYFTPTRPGVYTIEYSAVNANGLTVQETVEIEAFETQDKLGIQIENPINSGALGKKLKVADAYTLTNVTGKSSVRITATLQGNENVTYTIGEDLTFIPYYEGTYAVTFEYSDYLFSKTESFTVNAAAEGSTPLLEGTPLLPNYFIQGKRYEISELSGYIFTTGQPEKKACEVYLKEDGGNEVALIEETFTVSAEKELVLIYRLSDGVTTTERTFVRPVVIVEENGTLDISRYFVANTENAMAIAKSDCVELITAEESTWEFANLLAADQLEWRIRFDENALNFESVDFYLTDGADKEKTVKFSFKEEENAIIISVNDVQKLYIIASLRQFAEKDFSLKYNDSFHTLTIDKVHEVTVDTYNNGQKFEGFSSGKVAFKTGLSAVTKESCIRFRKINNQNIRILDKDKVSPIVYYKAYRGYQTVGDKLVFEAANAGDVLDPYTHLKFSVKDLNGNYVITDDGVTLDGTQDAGKTYSYTIEVFGSFEVFYEAVDSSGLDVFYSYVIHCVDKTAPTVTLTNIVREGTVGNAVKIATIQANDESGSLGISAFVTVTAPDGVVSTLNGNAFIASKVGRYTVQIFVFDATGNVATESYDVLIS